jgi:UDP-glucuronate decarboxylase
MNAVFSRVLLTGGAGFIGSHLLDKLLGEHGVEHGVEQVTVIDNLLTGSRENIQHHLQDDRLEFIEHDLTEAPWLEQFLAEKESNPYTMVLHFASPASPPRYQAEPVRTYLVNSYVTHQLAEYATKVGARMMFASTSEVYGDPEVHPQPENYWGNVNPNGLRSCYDESKRLGETICGVHVRDFSADIRLIRIFNTYGPRMDPTDGRVIPSFLSSYLRQEPLTIFGDGSQTRSFCYVDDLVQAIFLYLEKEGLAGETINLGNPYEFSMSQLATTLEKVVQEELDIEHLALPADDPKQRKPDIQKAKRLLGWEPTIQLEEGLRRTLEDFRQRG